MKKLKKVIKMEFEKIENMEEYTHIILEEEDKGFDLWVFEKKEFLENKEQLMKDAKAIYLAKKIM